MAEQQLQLGEVEQLDGMGNPAVLPRSPAEVDEEAELYKKSVTDPAPEPEMDLGIDEADFIPSDDEIYSPIQEVELPEPLDLPLAPPSEEQGKALAGFLSGATGAPVDQEEALAILGSRQPQKAVEDYLATVGELDEQSRTQAIHAAIMAPELNLEAKLALIKGLSERDTVDANSMQRQWLHAAVREDAEMDVDADDAALTDVLNQAVQEINPTIERPVSPDTGKPLSVRDEMLDLFERADQNVGLLDFAEQFVPGGSLPTLNKVVNRIYQKLGLTKANSGPAYTQVGSALHELRTMVEHADDTQKAQIARVVLDELKQNSGLIQDTNDLVTLHVLSNMFHKDIYGQDYAPLEEEKAALRKERDALKALPNPTKEQKARLRQVRSRLMEGKTEPAVDNIFNLLDAVGLGGAMRSTIKYGGRVGGRLWSNLSGKAPRVAAKRAVTALTDPATGKQLGMTPLELAEQFYPTAMGKSRVPVERGVNGFAEMNQRQRDAAKVKWRQAMASNLTPEEQARAFKEIEQDTVKLLHKPLPQLHLNQSDIRLSDDGTSADITAIFGKDSHRGYGTLGAAKKAKKDAVEDVFGADAQVDIVQRMPDGSFKKVDEALPDKTKGEFFQMAMDSRHLDSAGNTFSALTFADDTVDNLYMGSGLSQWTRGLNIFNNFTVDKISTRLREMKSMQSGFRGDFSRLASLSASQQQKLSRVLINSEGRELTERQLQRVFGGNKKLVQAYHDFRHIDDTMYHLEDMKVRNAYLREGLEDVRVDGARLGWGNGVHADDVAGKKVFDVETKTFHRYTQTELDNMARTGDVRFAKMKYDVHGQEGVVAKYVKLPNTRTRILPMPARGVLPRIKGHYPHIFKYNYIVKELGKDGSRSVAGALTKSDAMDYIRANPGRNLTIVDDSAMRQIDSYAQHLDELSTNRSGILFGKRSDDELENLSPWAQHSAVDPVEALLRGSEILSAAVTKGDLIQSMRVRLFNYLQSKEGMGIIGDATLKQKGALGLTLQDFGKGASSNVLAYNKAKAYMRQIDLMERSPDAWRRLTKEAYRGMAHMAYLVTEKLMLGKAGKNLQLTLADKARSGGDLAALYTGWLHRNYIAVMAPKQFVLQAAQSLMAAGLSPVGYAKAWRQFMAVSPAVMMRMNQLHGAKVGIKALDEDFAGNVSAARMAGMAPEEFHQVVRAITESGLVDAVSHNTMIRDAVGEAAERHARRLATTPRGAAAKATEGARSALRGIGQVLDTPFQYLSKVGFEAGENLNQIVTFLTLYNKDKAKGIANLANRNYLDDLVGRTSVLTGNMIKEASPAYTRSILKPLFQWIPFQHKMVLMALPKKIGGEGRFSGTDKAKIVASQFVLFGASSSAAVAVAHKAIEQQLVEQWEHDANAKPWQQEFVAFWRSNEVKQAMDGFVTDYLGNKVMQALFGEEVDGEFAWGKAFAPGAGMDFLADKLWSIATLDAEGALGVQGEYASNMMKYLQTVRNVVHARRNEVDDMSYEDRVHRMQHMGLTNLFPVYGKYVTGQWAMANEAYLSKGGTLGEGFESDVEVSLSTIFGIDTKDRASYYAARDRLSEDFGDSKKMGAEVKKIADAYWNNLVFTAVKMRKEAVDDAMYEAMLHEHMLNQGVMLSVLGNRDYALFTQHIEQKLERVYQGKGDTSESIFVENITKKLADGGLGSDGPAIAAYLKHLPFIKNNPEHAVMVDNAWRAIIEEPVPNTTMQPTQEVNE